MTVFATEILTDFLEARIDEDERNAKIVLTARASQEKWSATRVLRECAAKRRLIDWLEITDGDLHACDGIRSNVQLALRDLASVYADHPEYRSEWAT